MDSFEKTMEKNKRRLGTDYENIACEYLKQQGYEILERNFYSHAGEIDIIARHEAYLVFVEVKYRKSSGKGHPLEAISPKKQKRISKCALYYIKKQGLTDVPVRFDVVGILGAEIHLLKNAFYFII